MSNFPILKQQVIDSSGPISGAKLNTYEAGTSTPLATYSDRALTTPNANPVVADANGYIGECYLGTSAYKFVLTDADDNIIYTVDNIYGVGLSIDDLSTRLKQVASNPLDYGAVGDGVADESSEVQSAIDNATGVVDLLGKTFRCDSALSLSSGLRMINGALDFSNCSDDEYLTINGSIESSVTLTGDAAAGDLYISATSVSGLSVGDWIFVTSAGQWNGSTNLGELKQIAAFSSLDIYFASPLEVGFTVADNARFQKLTTVSGVVIENVEFVCSGSASGTGDCILARYAESITIQGCEFQGFKLNAIRAQMSAKVVVDGCRFEGDGASGTDNCVKFSESTTDSVIRNCNANYVIQFCTVGPIESHQGQCRHIAIRNNKAEARTRGVFIDTPSQIVEVSGNELISDAGAADKGIDSYGVDVRILNNKVKGYGDFAIRVDQTVTYTGSDPFRADATNNECEGGNIEIQGDGFDSVKVCENTISNPADDVAIRATSAPERLVISDNITHNDADDDGMGIQIVGGSRVKISGNNIWHADGLTDTFGIVATNTSGLSIVDNTVENADMGVQIAGSSADTDLVLNSNTLIDCTSGVRIDNSNASGLSNVAMNGNTITQVSGASEYCLVVEGYLNDMAIAGNIFNRSDDSAACVYLNGDAVDSISQVQFSGNVFNNGTWAIQNSNATGIVVAQNSYSGQSSGTFALSRFLEGPNSHAFRMAARNWSAQTAAGAYAGIFNAVAIDPTSADGSPLAVAVGDSAELQYSKDFSTWIAATKAGAYAGDFEGVTWDETGSTFVAVGSVGEIETDPNGAGTWTQQTPAAAFAGIFYAVHANSSGTIIAVGANGEVQRSTDAGVTWAQASGAIATDLHSVHYANNVWMSGGASGAMQKSVDDGQNWTAVTTPEVGTVFILGITNELSRWIVSAAAGEAAAYYSDDDGATWTKSTIQTTSGGTYTGGAVEQMACITAFDGLIVGGGDATYARKFFISTDGGVTFQIANALTLENATESNVNDVLGIAEAGGQIVAVGGNGVAGTSYMVTSQQQ